MTYNTDVIYSIQNSSLNAVWRKQPAIDFSVGNSWSAFYKERRFCPCCTAKQTPNGVNSCFFFRAEPQQYSYDIKLRTSISRRTPSASLHSRLSALHSLKLPTGKLFLPDRSALFFCFPLIALFPFFVLLTWATFRLWIPGSFFCFAPLCCNCSSCSWNN